MERRDRRRGRRGTAAWHGGEGGEWQPVLKTDVRRREGTGGRQGELVIVMVMLLPVLVLVLMVEHHAAPRHHAAQAHTTTPPSLGSLLWLSWPALGLVYQDRSTSMAAHDTTDPTDL